MVGLVPWINMLENQNVTFKTLEATRNSEEANRSELRMKQVRLEVDAAYRKITKRINAKSFQIKARIYSPLFTAF